MRRWRNLSALLLVLVLLPFGPTVRPIAAAGPRSDQPVVRFDRPVVLLDRHGDGAVAAAVGPLATADHIAVLVPGVGSTLANFWPGRGRAARRSPAWQAAQLYAAARRPGAERVAVVAWLGYDPPEGMGLAAAREDRAATGAVALVRFLAELARYRPHATLTVVGHSYGSVVVGLAAPHLNRQVTDIVAIGSPGMGVDRAADLHTHARVWAGAPASDWIHRVPGVRLLGLGHGRLPSTPRFGARPLPVDGVAGHDGYFGPETGSLRALASIMLGGCTQPSTCTTPSAEPGPGQPSPLS